MDKPIHIKLAEQRIQQLAEDNLIQLRAMATLESDENICFCNKCGWTATGQDFTVATGGDDYFGQCPVCFAPDDEIFDLLSN